MRAVISALTFALVTTFCVADDPAPGWMAYAVATFNNGDEAGAQVSESSRITHAEARWVVGKNPVQPGAFFSPWFGIESYDNKNLIQPVNPWEGYGWSYYIEQFRWDPEYNYDSPSHNTAAGHVLHGTVTWVPDQQKYNVTHTDEMTGETIVSVLDVQKDETTGNAKVFNIMYIVMEKSQWNCAQYPPDNEVVFYDISIEVDNKPATPQFQTSFVDDNCSCRAHVLNSTAVSITWKS